MHKLSCFCKVNYFLLSQFLYTVQPFNVVYPICFLVTWLPSLLSVHRKGVLKMFHWQESWKSKFPRKYDQCKAHTFPGTRRKSFIYRDNLSPCSGASTPGWQSKAGTDLVEYNSDIYWGRFINLCRRGWQGYPARHRPLVTYLCSCLTQEIQRSWDW